MGRRVYVPKPGERQRNLIDSAAAHGSHSPGWPHLDRHGNCLCLGGCCVGAGGCRCRACSHRSHAFGRPKADG
jgi:hypothetical protein